MLAEQRKIHAAELLPGGRLFPSGFHKISRRKEIERLSLLDGIRGGAIISMILYHACWDAVNIGGVQWPWFNGVYAYLWQQSICCSFIFLSGFCSTLSRTVVRRGLIIFLCGGIVTLATALAFPPGKIIFGILTLLGSCMLVTPLFKKLFAHVSPVWGLSAGLLFFILFRRLNTGFIVFGLLEVPAYLYHGYFGAYIGLTPAGFQSADYFPLIPWMFLFLAGYFLGILSARQGLFKYLTKNIPILSWLGRHSLMLYLAHQPVLLGIMLLFNHPQIGV